MIAKILKAFGYIPVDPEFKGRLNRLHSDLVKIGDRRKINAYNALFGKQRKFLNYNFISLN